MNSKNNLTIKLILVILTLSWMAFIFCMSARDGEESAEDSGIIGMLAGELFIKDFDTWTAEEQEAFAQSIDHFVRKCAHATEYSILGVFLLITLYVHRNTSLLNNQSFFRLCLYTQIICTLYAASDEFHQLFVPGRSGQLTDILIDSAGTMAALLLIMTMRKLKNLLISVKILTVC